MKLQWPITFKKSNPTAEGLRLPTGGRSSVEESVSLLGGIRQYHSWLDGLGPDLPPWMYQFCEQISLVNADMSQAVKNWTNIANTGHQVIIEGSDRQIETAIDRINELSYQIYQRSAGVDGLLNHYLAQIGRMGAISSEDELNPNLKGIRRVHIVPVRKIRFKYEENDYKPYQSITDPFSTNAELTADGYLVKLNETTYHIYCYQTIENSPYPVPPMLAAIEPVITQRDMLKNMQYIAKKLGLLGLVSLSLTPPPRRPNETEAEYKNRSEEYAATVLESMNKNFSQGMMVKYNDQTIEHFNITGEARGAKDIMQLNEEQVFSGIGTDPAMHGRSYSTTETYAGVVYNMLVNDANNFRRLAKRRMESTYRLDLLTMGITYEGVIFQWNPIPGMNRKDQEEAEGKRIENILKKRNEGIINQEEAAQELGYDEPWLSDEEVRYRQDNPTGSLWRDKILQVNRKVRFQFSKLKQRYIPVRQSIKILTISANASLAKSSDDLFAERVSKYLNTVLPFNKAAAGKAATAVSDYIREHKFEDFADEADFARRTMDITEGVVAMEMTDKTVRLKVAEQIRQIFSLYRLEDKSLFDPSSPLSFSFDTVDDRALGFLEKLDQFYMGKYVRNTGVRSPMMTFLKEHYLEKGKSVFDPDTLAKFRGLFQSKMIDLSTVQVRRIVNTSVSRLRNWGHVGQLFEAGIKTAKYYNPAPVAEICRYLNGQTISVPNLREGLQTLSLMTPEEFEGWLHPIGVSAAADMNAFALSGEGIPPFHPECKTELIVG